MILIQKPRDVIGGLVVIAIGAGFFLSGQELEMGTSFRMGPGYFPTILSILMIGLGAVIAETSLITNAMFLEAGRALAEALTTEDVASGLIFPPLARIRLVSRRIAAAVAELAWTEGLARRARPIDLDAEIAAYQFDPSYPDLAASVSVTR